MKLSLDHAHIMDRPGRVEIFTTDGRPFYFMDGPGRFTLPPGEYIVRQGQARIVGVMPERPFEPGPPRLPLPDALRVVVAPNPDKATIDLRSGAVRMDPAIVEMPAFVVAFVLAHELGHYWHESEAGADQFAARLLYSWGFNPSQVEAASRFALSDCKRRKMNLQTARILDGEG